MPFLIGFFLLELRERKMLSFINLRQWCMSVKKYSLMLTKVSKRAPIMVAYFRSKMNKFVVGIYDIVVNVCRLAMLIPNMDISRIMDRAKQIKG